VLARAASLDVASAAYMAAVLKYPKRNLALRHGARIVKRHDGIKQHWRGAWRRCAR